MLFIIDVKSRIVITVNGIPIKEQMLNCWTYILNWENSTFRVEIVNQNWELGISETIIAKSDMKLREIDYLRVWIYGEPGRHRNRDLIEFLSNLCLNKFI